MPAHDALFKVAFTDRDSARGELRAVLPEAIRARIDWDSLEVVKGSFVDPTLREQHTDLLFSVRLDGRDARIYVLFEHQSDVDEMMPFRFLGYEVRIWEQWRRENPGVHRLPVILPVLLSQKAWTAAVEVFDLFELPDPAERAAFAPHLPRLEVIVDDLALLEDDILARRDMPDTARLALAVLRHTRDAATLLALVQRLQRWMERLPETELASETLGAVLKYVGAVRGVGLEEIQAAVATVGGRVEDKVMTTLRQLEERGEARGEARGRRTALADTLVQLLTERFRTVPEPARARIAAAELPTLERWMARVLTAPTVEEVLAD